MSMMLGGQAGAKLPRELGMMVSPDTLVLINTITESLTAWLAVN